MENYITTALSEEFLNKKVEKAVNHIRETRTTHSRWFEPAIDYLYYPTCVYRTTGGNVWGEIYNIRHEFTNHIEFIVNPTTFEYSVRQIGFNGEISIWNSDVSSLTPAQKVMIEGILARTLLKCSQYAINDDWYIRVISGMIKKDSHSPVKDW